MRTICFLLLVACASLATPCLGESSLDALKKRQEEVAQEQNKKGMLQRKKSELMHGLEESAATSLEAVYDNLKRKGVSFDDVRPKLSQLNFAYRASGGNEMKVARSKDDARFVVSYDWGRNLAIIVPAGVGNLVTLRPDTKEVNIDTDGSIGKKCFVTIYRSYLGQDVHGSNLGRYPCADVLEQKHLTALTDAFVAWLTRTLEPEKKKR